jgi:CIC family chloride channel protein
VQTASEGTPVRLSGFRDREAQLTILLSLVIGVSVGLVVVAFILLTGRLAARLHPDTGAAWRRVVIPTIGSLVTGFLLVRYFPNARGSGIPQIKYALFINNGYISLRTVIGKFVCCATSLASGIALGREGPSAQIGAGIASVLGRRFGLGPEGVKALVPVGCSAALAAAFNTPIAAVLFSLEEIVGDMHAPVLGSVVIASATSWMTLHLILGDQPLFHVPAYQLVHPAEFGIYAILGVVGGLGSVCFVKLLLAIRARFLKFPSWTRWLQPAPGGLLVGLIAWPVPGVLGVGYEYVDTVLGGDFALKTVVVLAILKLIATPACYGSGNAGGIFGPSLFIGAMIGGSVGSVAHP